VLGLVVNLIIVRSCGVAVIKPAEWPKIVAIVLVSFAYVSIFVLLGLLVSGTMRHSASSMVLLLLLWVVVVILIPSSGRLVARALRNVSTQAAMERRSAAAIQEVVDNVIAGKYGKNAGNFTGDRESPIVNPPARARFKRALTEVRTRMLEDHIAQLIAQARAGRQFVRLSPVVLYQCTAEAMAGTGIDRWGNLYQQIKDYQTVLKDYVGGKDLEDPRSLHLLFEGEAEAAAWQTISRKPVDFDGVPKFKERRMTLGESLTSSIWDVGLLVLMNVVLFTAAHVSFTRYDVR
jgi:Ca2+/Na+ antiporter